MSIDKVKLINDKGDVIERYKHDYENNVERFNMRGWFLSEKKVAKEPVADVKQVVKKVKKKKTKK